MDQVSKKRVQSIEGWSCLALVSLLVVAAAASMLAPGSVAKDATAALAIITGAAVGIERALEAFWTYIGLTKHSWWPVNVMQAQINNLVGDLDTSLEPLNAE